MTEKGPKLPGWTRREPALTPRMDPWARSSNPPHLDFNVFGDPANDIAYKMIGGAYGVLGAEVLGHFVPRLLDGERWGVYVREAGIAWLCGQVAPRLAREPTLLSALPLRLARGIAAHHLTHHLVAEAVTESHGRNQYLQLLTTNAPRHPPIEEMLADALMRAEITRELLEPSLELMASTVNRLLALAPEGKHGWSGRITSELLAQLNRDLGLTITLAALDPRSHAFDVPHYLVLEPHLPGATAAVVRSQLLT